ncbi:unnamed protein product [Mytilus coruscus]|uniref:Integrase catalytic domain-containing protein n=1 Tax=Mytilus coruscus TaxID=42192 RepID=A0A6J8EQ75_MYTCO|nr:unnamed protein product [Mytilus coruscus]
MFCPVGLKNNPSFGSTKLLEISPVASGYVSTEPGLMISNTVVNFHKNRKFPLMIVNNTNKTVKLRRGCVVGKASHVGEINLVNVNQSQGTSGLEKLDESEISVPQEFKKDILRMIRDNEDIFATSDKDLGCTDTVQMTIDTGDHPPIRLKPYRAPLNQRKIIDKTIEELLEANIIRKSRSAWAAPIIIVSKKDKTSRMCVDYRSLNAASKIYSFPLPLIDDLLASVVEDIPEKKKFQFEEFDMSIEQVKDKTLRELKEQLVSDKVPEAVQNKYIIIDDILYYISNVDNDPIIRLYIPSHIKQAVVEQYHDKNGHMGIDKTFDSIRQKYFWPNMFKELYNYVTTCVPCQSRNLQKVRAPIQETKIPPYPFCHVGVDLSGPYPTTMSGNRYIIGFIDLYSGWPEAFSVATKSTDNVAHLLIEEITSRHSGIQILTSDNGGENCSKAMEEVCKELNIKHIKTSFYHPQGNAKIERFHRTLHDVLSKLIEDHSTTWDLYLNQALAAIRFNINESTQLSPFYALYNRDPVLPLDNILKPRRKYNGEEYHKIALQQQHKSFMLVHKTMKKSKQKQAKYANKHSKDIKFEVGNPVFYKNHRRASKLSRKWTPYYRIIEQTSPVSFILKNQLDGTTTKAHAEQIRLAKLDWEIPNNNQGKALRKAAYVVPVESQSEDSSDDESIDSDTPLNQISKRYKKERENSDEEDDIPLMELSKKLRGKKIFSEPDKVNNSQIESDDQVIKEEVENSPSGSDVSDIDDNMSITHPSPVASEISDMEDNMSVNRVKIKNNRKSPDIGANETKLEVQDRRDFRLATAKKKKPLNEEFHAIQKLINLSESIIIDKYCGLPSKFTEIIERRTNFAEMHNIPYLEHLRKWTVENFKAIGWLKRSNRFRVYYQEVILDGARKMHRLRIFNLTATCQKIRRNIKTLAQNQDAIRHIVQDGLTILNTTQTHVSENRHKVNELIESVQDLGNRLKTFATDLEKQIEVMGSYLQAYLHMDMIIGEIKDLMNIAGDYLNHLQLQLNMLSLGHMSPSLISPGNLRVLLTDIKRRLPATLKIPGDEIKDIWNFYKFLTCSTVLDENRIIIIITLPLLDIRDSYAIYKIHNLPVPTKVTDKNSDSSDMVAQYELEAVVIAANQEKTKYMLLSNQEIDKCSNPLVNFCEIKSPVYPVNLSKLCVIALFANKENWKTRCTVKVRPNTVLPMATYLTDSMWAVTTINEFRITIRCDDKTNMLTDQIINPPTTIINLKRTCTATSDHLTLLSTYQMESTFFNRKNV